MGFHFSVLWTVWHKCSLRRGGGSAARFKISHGGSALRSWSYKTVSLIMVECTLLWMSTTISMHLLESKDSGMFPLWFISNLLRRTSYLEDSQRLPYNYVPSLAAGIIFVTLFGLSTRRLHPSSRFFLPLISNLQSCTLYKASAIACGGCCRPSFWAELER